MSEKTGKQQSFVVILAQISRFVALDVLVVGLNRACVCLLCLSFHRNGVVFTKLRCAVRVRLIQNYIFIKGEIVTMKITAFL